MKRKLLACCYDLAGRLSTVSDTVCTSTDGYVPQSRLVQTVTGTGGATMATTRSYDGLNRLQSISSAASAVPMPASYAYQYNAANQRDRATLADGSYWSYGYDSLGQVTGGKHYWNDGTPVAGQQYEYGFDTIGNRSTAKIGGDASGGNLRSIGYAVNNLNQYTSRTNSSAVDVLGLAVPSQSVAINGTTAYRKGEYFHHAKAVDNVSAPAYTNITVTSGAESSSGYVFVPKQLESFGYDADGNLTNDGRWSFTWDAENRLVKMEPSGTVTPPPNSRRKLEFAYDWMGRRICKRVTNLDTSLVTQERYLYDGWNLIAVIDGSTATLLKSFVWGTDLSGTLQGAGGVGGLLKVRQHSPSAANAYVAYDGNGNVVGLVNTAEGKFSARYEYGPFGEVIRATGPARGTNPFRFSTKYQDDETDLLYYGYRYYSPSTGRWVNWDLLEEAEGLNLYAAVDNDLQSYVDVLGAWKWSKFWPKPACSEPLHADRKRMNVVVEKCEIVILFGHGSEADHWNWKMSPQCSAGAGVMCWPDANSTGIPDDKDLQPNRRDPDCTIIWGKRIPSPNDPKLDRETKMPLADGLFDEVYRNAMLRAFDLCQQNCCNTIKVRFVWVPKSLKLDPIENPTNAQTDYQGKVNIQNFNIDCRTLKRTYVPRRK